MASVRLTPANLNRAEAAAIRRQEFHETNGTPDAHGFSGNGYLSHLDGTISELAVAIHAGAEEEWIEFDEDFKGIRHDVAGVQVRSTRHGRGNLIVHQNGNPDDAYVLVRLHQLPWAVLVGWAYGYEAQLPQFWGEPRKNRPCYLYPAERLRLMDSVPYLTKEVQ